MSPNHHLIFRETKTEFRSAVVLILKRQGHDLKSVVWIFRPMHLCRKQNWQQLQRYNLFFLAKMWEAKINEALLFKVTSRRAVEWRDYSWATASVCVCVCVCVRVRAHFKLSCWGKCGRHSLLPSPWKPPLFHRQRGRARLHSESGVWIIPHYLALILLPSVLSTAD